MSKETLISALIYIDRMTKVASFQITSFEIHRVLVIACILSIKYNCDEFYDNVYYAHVAGTSLKEFNEIEEEFLCILEYNLFIHEDQYIAFCQRFKEYISEPPSHSNGLFSYESCETQESGSEECSMTDIVQQHSGVENY